MGLTERASIDLGLFDLLHRPYRETTIDRDTVYRFNRGARCSCSKDPTAAAMSVQAYAQIVDKTLTYDDLPALGAKLKFPSGWRYSTTWPAPREKRPWCRTISTTPIRSWIDLS